jgi:hypothetical protein
MTIKSEPMLFEPEARFGCATGQKLQGNESV